MAGLPKRRQILVVIPLLLLALTACAMAQEIQTPSVVIGPIVQSPSTTLQPMIDIVEANTDASDDQKQALIDALTSAIGGELITVDEAIGLLNELDWPMASTDDEIAQAIGLLTDVLAGIAAGEIDDPIAALIELHNAALTPDGVVNAITNAGASDETILQAESLVAAGLPPGIVLRVTKDGLSEDLSQDEIDAMLDELAAAYADGSSAGQAANAATGQGSYRHEEQEEEQNANEGEADEPQAASEENENGPRETSAGDEEEIEDPDDEPSDEHGPPDKDAKKDKTNNGNNKA